MQNAKILYKIGKQFSVFLVEPPVDNPFFLLSENNLWQLNFRGTKNGLIEQPQFSWKKAQKLTPLVHPIPPRWCYFWGPAESQFPT